MEDVITTMGQVEEGEGEATDTVPMEMRVDINLETTM
jgi:hypothetical protein